MVCSLVRGVAYDFQRVLIWRARAAHMRQRAVHAGSPSDVEDFEMLARYWDGRAEEGERSNPPLERGPLPAENPAAAPTDREHEGR